MKASIKPVLLKHKKLKNGKYPVFLRVTIDRKIKYFSIGSDYNCTEKEWSKKEGYFKPNIKNAQDMNEHIDEVTQKARKTAIKLEQKGINYTIEDFHLAYTRKGNAIMLLNYFDEVIKDMNVSGKIGNADIYQQTRNRLEAFLETKKLHLDVGIISVDIKFLREWEKFLRLTCEDRTIHLRMRTLRALINKARQEEGFDYYVFDNYSLSHLSTTTPKRALKIDEIKTIFNYKTTPDIRKYHSLNYFKFMYLCKGMNFTDICLLQKDQIKKDKFTYERAKTHSIYEIPLFKPSKKIIKEYSKMTLDSPYVFPILTEQHDTPRKIKDKIKSALKALNKDLKNIAEELEINKKVTSYTSRHTFATILKYLGESTEIISEQLGHASVKTTQGYLADFEEKTLKDSTAKAVNAVI